MVHTESVQISEPLLYTFLMFLVMQMNMLFSIVCVCFVTGFLTIFCKIKNNLALSSMGVLMPRDPNFDKYFLLTFEVSLGRFTHYIA